MTLNRRGGQRNAQFRDGEGIIPMSAVQTDSSGRQFITLPNGQRSYTQPLGFDANGNFTYDPRALAQFNDSGGTFHKPSTWNAESGQYDEGSLDWGAIIPWLGAAAMGAYVAGPAIAGIHGGTGGATAATTGFDTAGDAWASAALGDGLAGGGAAASTAPAVAPAVTGATKAGLLKTLLPALTSGGAEALRYKETQDVLKQQKELGQQGTALTESQLDPYRQNMGQVRDLAALDRLATTDYAPSTARPSGPWSGYGGSVKPKAFYTPTPALIAAALATQKQVATGKGGLGTMTEPANWGASSNLDLSGDFSGGSPWLTDPNSTPRRRRLPRVAA